jgi:hypothetical protein
MDVGLILMSREEECCQAYSVIKGGRMEEWMSGLYMCCQGGLKSGGHIVLSRQRGGM